MTTFGRLSPVLGAAAAWLLAAAGIAAVPAGAFSPVTPSRTLGVGRGNARDAALLLPRVPTPLAVAELSASHRGSLARLSAATAGASSSSSDGVHTIQILMSDTGGGHRASANALRDALDALYPGQFQCDIVDIYTDYGPFFPYNAYVPLYKIMAEYSFLWDWFYHFGATPLGLALNEFFLEAFCFDPFKECMSRDSGDTGKRAEMVVSVHPLCQDIPLKIMTSLDTNGKSRTKGRTTPFVTVVTDLGGAHPTWFNKGVDTCFVPSDVLYDAAIKRGVQPSQLIERGLPIRSGFWGDHADAPSAAKPAGGKKEGGLFGWFPFGTGESSAAKGEKSIVSGAKKSKSQLRDELELKQDIPTVLVVGGGDGMGGIVGQAEALGAKLNADAPDDASDPAFQMVVVCGNNEGAQKQLEAKQWGKGVAVQVNGFVYNMDEYMRASDAIVTKAGPGTIAEASICGLPCMLSSYLPGQEAGNVPYVEEAGFGSYSGDPTKIANTVSTWLETPEMLSEMKGKALDAARPSATLDIARDIAEMLFEKKREDAAAPSA